MICGHACQTSQIYRVYLSRNSGYKPTSIRLIEPALHISNEDIFDGRMIPKTKESGTTKQKSDSNQKYKKNKVISLLKGSQDKPRSKLHSLFHKRNYV